MACCSSHLFNEHCPSVTQLSLLSRMEYEDWARAVCTCVAGRAQSGTLRPWTGARVRPASPCWLPEHQWPCLLAGLSLQVFKLLEQSWNTGCSIRLVSDWHQLTKAKLSTRTHRPLPRVCLLGPSIG